jgi:signal transduction histidine kinase
VPQDADRMRALVDEAIRERRDFNCDYRITLADGSIRVLNDRGGTILNEEGAPIRLVGTAQDVTELRKAEQALQEYAARLQNLSRRLLEVQEEERRHLARELHDEVGQILTSLRLILKPTADLTTNAATAGFEKARALVDELLETVRQLSFDLRPAALDQLGLLAGLLALFDRYTKQTGVLVNFKHQGVNGRFAPEVETTAYRIVQEALTNVARHAAAASVSVTVWTTVDMLSAQIEDRGRGFDAEDALARVRSSGLPGMQERVTLLGGLLTIESRPGAGTQITAALPLSQAGGEP